MAIDWGGILGDLVEAGTRRVGAPAPVSFPLMPASAPAYPSTVVGPPRGTGDPNYNGQAWACKKRRRRRPILTQTDIGILFQISTLPNNANVRTALARSIRR